jgi:hypothetical protein
MTILAADRYLLRLNLGGRSHRASWTAQRLKLSHSEIWGSHPSNLQTIDQPRMRPASLKDESESGFKPEQVAACGGYKTAHRIRGVR